MNGMITANRLSDGLVVFFDAAGGWTEDFNRALVLNDEATKAQGLAQAALTAADNVVIDPYWIDLETRAGHLVPKALREAIRAAGPTNRPDLGKQAHGLGPTLVQRA